MQNIIRICRCILLGTLSFQFGHPPHIVLMSRHWWWHQVLSSSPMLSYVVSVSGTFSLPKLLTITVRRWNMTVVVVPSKKDILQSKLMLSSLFLVPLPWGSFQSCTWSSSVCLHRLINVGSCLQHSRWVRTKKFVYLSSVVRVCMGWSILFTAILYVWVSIGPG